MLDPGRSTVEGSENGREALRWRERVVRVPEADEAYRNVFIKSKFGVALAFCAAGATKGKIFRGFRAGAIGLLGEVLSLLRRRWGRTAP